MNPKEVQFCILNTILAFIWTFEPSEGLAFCTGAKGALVGFALIHLHQILEEHLLGIQIDLEMNSQLLCDLEPVASLLKEADVWTGKGIAGYGGGELRLIGCFTLGERVSMPGPQFL